MLPTLLTTAASAPWSYGPSEWGPLLRYFLWFAWGIYAFESYLQWRQHRLLRVRTKPKDLTYVTQEEFDKAQAYGLDRSRLSFFEDAWGQSKLTLQFVVGYFPLLWTLSGLVLHDLTGKNSPDHPILQSVVFFCLDTLFENIIGVPVGLYRHFVVEEKHGFNKQTIGLYFSDKVKGLLLNCLIGGPLIALFISVIEWGGEHFYLYVSALMLVVQLIAVPVYANFIQPLFNKVESLPAGTLRTSIEKLADSLKFPLTGLYVIDGSKRSSHSNAYFYGFFKSKRIVLYDTLITQSTEPQVLAVLSHELGHWSLNHTIKNLMLGQVQMLSLFFLFGHMMQNEALFNDFGFKDPLVRPTYIGLLFFQCIYSPVQHVLAFIMNVVSRHFEFQADEFAAKLGYGQELKEGLITLQKENKSTMLPDSWYSAYHHSHPPLLERLRAIDATLDKEGKKVQ